MRKSSANACDESSHQMPSQISERHRPTSMRFTLAPELSSIVRPGVLWLDGATVIERDARLDGPLATAEAAVRARPPAEITAVRTMYKRVGLDPTKTRPSSEALLRRVRKGDSLPRINSMVDVC